MARFREAIEEVLASIPPDHVATCGAVAQALGDLRAARTVAAWVLEHEEVEGADRVVRADGRAVLRPRRGRKPGASRPLATRLAHIGLLAALREEQERLEGQVSETDEVGAIGSVGGVDVAYEGDVAYAVAVRCDPETLEPAEVATLSVQVDFPYIPTYLAFREFPPVEAALARLRRRPDVLLVDGHGRLHPAHFGFACYVGVRLRIPTIGVAKHPLAGRTRALPDATGGLPIDLDGAVRGYAWIPPDAGRAIYVSVGHGISLGRALDLVRRATRSRYPEPLRVADRLCKGEKHEKKVGKGGDPKMGGPRP